MLRMPSAGLPTPHHSCSWAPQMLSLLLSHFPGEMSFPKDPNSLQCSANLPLAPSKDLPSPTGPTNTSKEGLNVQNG